MGVAQGAWHSRNAGITGLERLEALEDLRTLKARYFYHLDRQDGVRRGAVFTRDATLDVSSQFPDSDPADFRLTGIAAIVALVSGMTAGVVSAHHGHTPILETD
ncbi:nuclear transport factor 2 family protein [uncultured Sphingomonas sp.]|uniref:nuclear transport factor 2 family protein n=1 Tax=uncultured Sphingomonas sp. TaxID=158754 RepID=UPI0034281020